MDNNRYILMIFFSIPGAQYLVTSNGYVEKHLRNKFHTIALIHKAFF